MPSRIKTLREEKGLTQDQVAASMGFANRQTVADIEAGKRRIQPEELIRLTEIFGVDLEHLTDPFRLVGEGRFNFRTGDVSGGVIDEFEAQAGRWIATYRELRSEAGVRASRLTHKLDLGERSSFEDAQEAGEQVHALWNLGDVPAARLPEAIREELDTEVLFVDAPPGLSGAAIELPGLNAILINRSEPAGRRNFDLAHELFHLLTWEAMPPTRVEPREIPRRKGNRVERLAENFAGALLMPGRILRDRWEDRGDEELTDWLNRTATDLQVTALALKWRLVAANLLAKAEVQGIDDRDLAGNGGAAQAPPPPPFSPDFVARMHDAVEAGRLSLAKATRLLGATPSDFAELCDTYGLDLSYEL